MIGKIQKLSVISGVMLLFGLVRTVDACAQSDPTSPLDGRSECSVNFSDADFLDDSIPSTATPATPIQWNLTDQPNLDQCERDVGLVRAGYPLSISRRAATTYNQKYEGYYVGGGVPTGRSKNETRGEPRYRNEGTWGMDYAPFYSRVASNWSHGRLFQGGIGQYEPDHKNRPFGQTFGKHFGNRDRRFESAHDAGDFHAELWSPTPVPGHDP